MQIIIQHKFKELINVSQGQLDFKNTKFPLEIRDIGQTEEKNCISITVLSYKDKEKKSNICVRKYFLKKC